MVVKRNCILITRKALKNFLFWSTFFEKISKIDKEGKRIKITCVF